MKRTITLLIGGIAIGMSLLPTRVESRPQTGAQSGTTTTPGAASTKSESSTRPAPARAVAVQPQSTTIPKFKIIDTSGVETEVTGLDFDYSLYPTNTFGISFYTPDHETTGFRILRGQGKLTVRWTNIAVFRMESDILGLTVTLELVSGTTQKVQLISVTRDLKAKSELGDFSIPLRKVREIRPVR